MHRLLTRGFLLVTACLLHAGCATSIRFSADTIVSADGAISRSTLVAVTSDGTYNEVNEHYELAPGGEWVELPRPQSEYEDDTGPAKPVYTRGYRLSRELRSEEPIASDFVRYDSTRTRAATNAIDIEVRRGWFADSYHYAESFSDIVTEERFIATIENLTDRFLRAFAEEAAALPATGVTVEEAEIRIRAWADPIIERFVAVFRSECAAPGASIAFCEQAMIEDEFAEAIIDMIDGSALPEDLVASLFPPPPDADAELWITDLATVIGERLDRRDDLDFADELAEDDLFGAHGFALFISYPFEVRVTLPGSIVETNATARAGDVLTWSFLSEAFWLSPYSLTARSRVVHAERVLFLLIALVAVTGMTASWRTRRAGT